MDLLLIGSHCYSLKFCVVSDLKMHGHPFALEYRGEGEPRRWGLLKHQLDDYARVKQHQAALLERSDP